MRFSRGQQLQFLSHLDMMRLWERAFRRAKLPLRYSEGFHPQPRLSLALPLAVGMTAAEEWLEVEMDNRLPPSEICQRLEPQLPRGLTLLWVGEAPQSARSLMSRLRAAEYEIGVREPEPAAQAQERIRGFQEKESWPVEKKKRKGKVRVLDLKEVIEEIQLKEWEKDEGWLLLRIRYGPKGTVRPRRILRELSLGTPIRYHRIKLCFQPTPQVEGKEVWCGDKQRR